MKYSNMQIRGGKIRFGISILLNYIRTFIILRLINRFGVKYHGFVRIMKGTTFERKGIVIGNNVQFGPDCRVLHEVHFGDNILMASQVCFIGRNDHSFNVVGQTIWDGERGKDLPTIVENDVWIGHGCVVLAGVTIGCGSIVAAEAVVTKDIPPCEIWGGNPARKIKDRFANPNDKERHLRIIRHNWGYS